MQVFVPLIVLNLLFIVFLLSSLKISREDQRLVVFRLGRFMGIKGPGLIFVIPHTDKVHKLSVGDLGELMAPGQAKFGKTVVPVESNENLSIGSVVRIRGFKESSVLVMQSPNQSRRVRCQKCGHEMTV